MRTHPLLSQSLHARHRLKGQEQRLVGEVKSAYHAARVQIEPTVNGLMARYSEAMAPDPSDGTPAEPVGHGWLRSPSGGDWPRVAVAIRTHLDTFTTHATHLTTAAQATAAHAAVQDTRQQLHSALAPAFALGLPHDSVQTARMSAVDALAGRSVAGGSLADRFSGLGDGVAASIEQRLSAGLASGWGPRQVASQLWRDLGIAQSAALTIARSEMLGAYRQAASLNYQANSDVLDGWFWLCALDGRCCGACAAMNGTFHSLDETLDSHAQCRCTQVPKTKGWSDLLPDVDTSDLPDTGVSADDFQDGEDWLSGQDAATQANVLGGNAARNAYQHGAFSLADMVGTTPSGSVYQQSLKGMGINWQNYTKQ